MSEAKTTYFARSGAMFDELQVSIDALGLKINEIFGRGQGAIPGHMATVHFCRSPAPELGQNVDLLHDTRPDFAAKYWCHCAVCAPVFH